MTGASWEKDLSDSSYDFRRLVWPRIKEVCCGGELIAVESVSAAPFAAQLDRLAGIDAWQVVNHLGIRGIASRIQWGPTDWRTFTIREWRRFGTTTELEKRIRAQRDPSYGWLFPALTVQAYITERRVGELISTAVVRTADLLEYMNCHPRGEGWGSQDNKDGRSGFRWVSWDAAAERGLRIWSWCADPAPAGAR